MISSVVKPGERNGSHLHIAFAGVFLVLAFPNRDELEVAAQFHGREVNFLVSYLEGYLPVPKCQNLRLELHSLFVEVLALTDVFVLGEGNFLQVEEGLLTLHLSMIPSEVFFLCFFVRPWLYPFV